MLINKSNVQAIFLNILTIFNKALGTAPSTWAKIAMKVQSSTAQNDYAWLSRFPKMKKWIGEKHIKSLEGFKYSIANEDFEATVEVRRNDIEDDNLGIYAPMAQGAAYSSAQLPDELVYALVNAGFTTKCYDGQYFFDTDHDVGGASVSNKLTVALSCATLAAATASFGAARTAMRKFKDDEGRPLGSNGNILLVPAALEDIAKVLMTNERLEDGKPNPYKGAAEVVVGDWLTSDTAWFLLDTTKPVKPFIYQERKAPVFVSMTNIESDEVYKRGNFLFGAEARGAAGYGFWQLAVGSTG